MVEALRKGVGSQLKQVDLMDTHMGDTGAEALIEALDAGARPRLEDLTFRAGHDFTTVHGDGGLGEATDERLCEAVEGNFRCWVRSALVFFGCMRLRSRRKLLALGEAEKKGGQSKLDRLIAPLTACH